MAELKKHGVFRRMLHVGNICKCFPKNTKTPTKQEADKCFLKWGLAEIKSMDCRLILGLGGTVYYALTGKAAGITKVSGQIEWVDKVGAWVVWCVHPSFVLRSNSADNQGLFKEGIRVFVDSFKKNIK
jgi:uracil-DNA glycosylase family 4